ncbi:MAG: glycosyltransferase family 2 protein, partial [Desulfomonilaceae bacterium]
MKFSVITPSYNQGSFIERTIKSVLDQSGDFIMDFAVIDGGSTDTTVAILSQYELETENYQSQPGCHLIDYSWVSEKDGGQADAVNKGIARTSGEIIAWINSDDIYYPGAFERVRKIFEQYPDVDVIYGLSNFIDEHDNVTEPFPTEPWNYRRLFDECYICQPGAFFRRRLIEQFGPLDPELMFCLDYELWLRFGKSARFFYLEELLAGSRMYSSNKTLGQRVAVHNEINEMFLKRFGRVPRKWIYGYAEVVAEDRMKEQGLDRV